MKEVPFPNNLKEYRLRLGLSLEAVAAILGLPKNGVRSIAQWEEGLANPSQKNMFMMAEIYGASILDLYKHK